MARRQSLVRLWVCGALLVGAATLRAQSRFEALTHEPLAGPPGLEVVTVRDHLLNGCYTLFVTRSAPLQTTAPVEPPSVADAAAERDRRLSDLSASLEKALVNNVPGSLGPDMLKYEWEGQKVQSEFDRV